MRNILIPALTGWSQYAVLESLFFLHPPPSTPTNPSHYLFCSLLFFFFSSGCLLKLPFEVNFWAIELPFLFSFCNGICVLCTEYPQVHFVGLIFLSSPFECEHLSRGFLDSRFLCNAPNKKRLPYSVSTVCAWSILVNCFLLALYRIVLSTCSVCCIKFASSFSYFPFLRPIPLLNTGHCVLFSSKICSTMGCHGFLLGWQVGLMERCPPFPQVFVYAAMSFLEVLDLIGFWSFFSLYSLPAGLLADIPICSFPFFLHYDIPKASAMPFCPTYVAFMHGA